MRKIYIRTEVLLSQCRDIACFGPPNAWWSHEQTTGLLKFSSGFKRGGPRRRVEKGRRGRGGIYDTNFGFLLYGDTGLVGVAKRNTDARG